MMSTPNRAILDSTTKENFNGNHMGLQGRKWSWKNQQFENKDQSFDQQGSKDKKFKSKLQEESQGNIPTRIDPSKVKIDCCLSVTVSLRFSRF